MPLKAQSVEAQIVADLTAVAIVAAMIAADVVTRRLLDENPDCQVPFEHLRDTIATMAVKMGVGVEFGQRE